MKKVLMGTTALVAMGAWAVSPAVAQEKIKLNVGGYYMSVLSYSDQSFDTPGIETLPFTVRQEGEIQFTGETTLDNGLTFGVNVQLEAVTQGDQLDEQYIYIEGDMGKVVIGSENSVAYLMGNNAPAVGLGVNSPTFLPFNIINSAPTSTYVTRLSDNNKISYYTPRFSGFQFGLSFTPNDDAGGGSRQSGGLSLDNTVGDQANNISVGLNFVNSFNGFDVSLSGGYERGDLEANAGANDDADQWQLAAIFGFSGFSVGGSYGQTNNGLAGNFDSTSWDAGVSYGVGPWGISLTYLNGERERGAIAEDEMDYFELGGSYALGPGVKLFGGVQVLDLDGATAARRSDGVAVSVGTKLSF